MEAAEPKVLFVLGGPGAGKGTQCAKVIANYTQWAHISVGDRLRMECSDSESKEGQLINSFNEEGKMVPSEITLGLLLKEMKELQQFAGKTSFLIEGLPGSVGDVNSWDEVIGDKAHTLGVLFYDAEWEEMETRLLWRGRVDDTIESIRKRFSTFLEDNMPMFRKFEEKGLVFKVDAMLPPEEVWAATQAILNKIEKSEQTVPFDPPPSVGTQVWGDGSNEHADLSALEANLVDVIALVGDAHEQFGPGMDPCNAWTAHMDRSVVGNVSPVVASGHSRLALSACLPMITAEPKVLFVLGGPGAGKGTQCAKIIENNKQWAHISVGSGHTAKLLVKEMTELQQFGGKTSFLVDGLPQSLGSMNSWEEAISNKAEVLGVLFYDAEWEEMEERLLRRGLAGDNVESIRRRFSTFLEGAMPIFKKYEQKGLVWKIDAMPPPVEVWTVTQATLSKIEASNPKILYDPPPSLGMPPALNAVASADVDRSGFGADLADVPALDGDVIEHSLKNLSVVEIDGMLPQEQVWAASQVTPVKLEKSEPNVVFNSPPPLSVEQWVQGNGSTAAMDLEADLAQVLALIGHANQHSRLCMDHIKNLPEEITVKQTMPLAKKYEEEVPVFKIDAMPPPHEVWAEAQATIAKIEERNPSVVLDLPPQASVGGAWARCDGSIAPMDLPVLELEADLANVLELVSDTHAHSSPLRNLPDTSSMDNLVVASGRSRSLPARVKNERFRVLFVLGGPGVGKSTQCAKIIKNNKQWAHISVGDCLRMERSNSESEEGQLINSFIKEGKLVPSDITVRLLEKAMKQQQQIEGKTSFLIEGFPRRLSNLNSWKEMIGDKVDVLGVLFYDAAREEIERRLLGRLDANIESIRNRFGTFLEETLPVIERYEEEGLVFKIDAMPPPEEVWAMTQALLTKIEGSKQKTLFDPQPPVGTRVRKPSAGISTRFSMCLTGVVKKTVTSLKEATLKQPKSNKERPQRQQTFEQLAKNVVTLLPQFIMTDENTYILSPRGDGTEKARQQQQGELLLKQDALVRETEEAKFKMMINDLTRRSGGSVDQEVAQRA